MATTKTCDICHKPVERFVGKLYLTPAGSRKDHNEYTHRIDFGQCCLTTVHQLGSWQKRKTRAPKVAA